MAAESARPEPAAAETGFSSEGYWKRRYRKGGNSGAGSYGRLADYKAAYINDLVQRHAIGSVVEYGSGDGNQASLFSFPTYTGIDISPDAVTACRARFADRPGWTFALAEGQPVTPHDLAMSLDVIYHLVEDAVYGMYMQRLFDSGQRFVLIYASDHEAAASAEHVRHRCFSDWVRQNRPGWTLVDAPDNPYPMGRRSDPKNTSFAAFKLFKAPA